MYAHPHPVSADTTALRNSAGLPLPTELTGESEAAGLIGKEEQGAREGRMRKICQSCHSRQRVDGHYEKFTRTIETTNAMTLAQGDSIFNEMLDHVRFLESSREK